MIKLNTAFPLIMKLRIKHLILSLKDWKIFIFQVDCIRNIGNGRKVAGLDF